MLHSELCFVCMRKDDLRGSLKAGWRADIVVVDRHIVTSAPAGQFSGL